VLRANLVPLFLAFFIDALSTTKWHDGETSRR